MEIGAGVEDVCFAAGTPIALAPVVEESEHLRRLTTAGEVTAIFGQLTYRSASASLNYVLSSGRIACGRRSPLVFYGSTLGELRACRTNGEQLWAAAIESFIGPDARELEGGRYAMLIQDHSSGLAGLTVLHDEALLVQVSQLERQDAGWQEQTRLDSYLLDPLTGDGGYVGSELPFVVAARPGMIATLTNDDYPRIALLATGGL